VHFHSVAVITTRKQEEMAEAKICTICQSSIYDGRDYVTTSCQHTFHTECIATNANINDNKCPNCRQSIPSFRNIFTGYTSTSTTAKKKENLISHEVYYAKILSHFNLFLIDIG
jgi:hypothetical protein